MAGEYGNNTSGVLMYKPLIISLLISAFTSSNAWSKSEACESKHIKKIARPTFSYSFFHVAADEGSPTVLFIPGGPGQTSIDNKGVEIPLSFGIIYTDPRGVGCNEVDSTKTPDEFYTTQNVASDIVSIVSELKLKNYIIYGQSWGTAVAQIAVSQIEKLGLVPPKALVLEGVLGRAFATKSEVLDGFNQSWKNIKNQMEPEIIKGLTNDSYMGLTSEEWGSLIRGRLATGEAKTIDFLTQVSQMPDYNVQAQLRAANGVKPVDPNHKKLYDLIACRQMYNNNSELNRNIVLVNGELDFGKSSLCQGIESLNPFDSKIWQVKTKTYYFSGASDPLTPVWQRDYHINNQKSSEKVVITLNGAGHLPLRSDLFLLSRKIWNSINENGKDLKSIVGEP